MLTKKEIRKTVLAKRRDLDEETVALASQVICNKIIKIDIYEQADNLCLYIPINNEVDVLMLASFAVKSGKKVWVPKVTKKGKVGQPGEMIFNRHEGADKTVIGAYEIAESTSEEILRPDEKTVIIMPGAAFTPWRDRIGYGGGFYDRFISKYPMCKTIAVCFDLQVVPEIPVEEFDIKPDYIVSETSVYI